MVVVVVVVAAVVVVAMVVVREDSTMRYTCVRECVCVLREIKVGVSKPAQTKKMCVFSVYVF